MLQPRNFIERIEAVVLIPSTTDRWTPSLRSLWAFAQDFGVNLMTPGTSTLPVLPARRPSPSTHVKVAALWGPILFEEIQRKILRLNSAAGPEWMTPHHLRKLPWDFLTIK
ncbi:hypothetical protein AVEN_87711-1 [Araneus ventricosus]|uniref:Uncharacterized protein n=1 Tax=Araneus ventricosus TaxID=182803 RepID=A0A4Y2QKN8_ARAVE|nr:hypothetical protein AVEN_118468-1 [Araneus ventricosus]GBN63979.1 hypothetical protein AVEN_87711-1 [Araneus ventricosus]